MAVSNAVPREAAQRALEGLI